MRTSILLLLLAACDGPSDKPADDTGAPDPNEAPGAPVIELSPGSPTGADDLRVVFISEATDPDGDAVTYRYLWFRDGAVVEDQVGDNVPADVTTKGETWRVVVVATDGELDATAVEAEVTVINTPPVATVTVAPDAPLTVDDLVATASAEDADGDTVAFTYVWSVDGADAGYTGETIPADATTRGETWTVTVTPDDGEELGEAVTFDVTIGNTAPAITSAALDPAEVRAGTEVACVPSGWADDDGDAEGYTWEWFVNGVSVATTPTLAGAFVTGDTVSCVVTPTDGAEAGPPVSSETATVLNTAPSIDAATLSTTSPVEADTLSVSLSGAYDIDGDAIAYAYEWYVDGVWVSDAETIDGTLFTKGDTIYVEVTPSDYADSGAMVTSDVATVANTAPVVNVVSLSPSTVYTDDTLTASVIANDADGDALTYTYAWTVDGAAVAATGSTLDGASWFDRDDVVTVTVTPDDGEAAGTAASASVTVLNTAPGAPTAAIDPDEPTQDDDLVCYVATAAADDDGDAISYTVAWTVDGAAYSGATTTDVTGDTVPASATEAGEVWTCTVTPDDGSDSGAAATASVTIVEVTFTGWGSAELGLSRSDYKLVGESSEDRAGAYGSAVGDADGDGLADMLVAARGNDEAGASAGKVYLVTAGDLGASRSIDLGATTYAFTGEAAGDGLSAGATPLGDVDGDGLDDLLFVGRFASGGGSAYGEVWVLRAAGLRAGTVGMGSADYSFTGEATYDIAEHGHAGAGDVDGDGLADLLTAANGSDDAGTDAGKVALFFGSGLGAASGGTIGDGDYVFLGENAGDGAGFSVSSAGDVDGDGLGDLLIGAMGNDDGGTDAGKSYLLLGAGLGGTGTVDLSAADHTFVGESAGDGSPYYLAGLPDFDGDGGADLFISGHGSDRGGTDAGAAYVVLGSSLGSTRAMDLSAADHILVGEAAGDIAGVFLASAGDVDVDGRTDLLLGAHRHDGVGTDAGQVHLVFADTVGSARTFSLASADYTFTGESAEDNAGSCVAGVGDVDGDRLDDLLVGAHRDDDGGSNAGAAYVLLTP